MSERMRIQRKREKAAVLPTIQSETSQRGPFVSQQDVDEVPSIVDEVLSSSGQPLDSETRASMEPRFGHDFSKVQVHTDKRAVESAQAVNALAYTVGQDVVFAERQYAPESSEGQQLLAHELTHVVQQRNISASGPQMVGPAGDSYEQEANRMSAAIASNASPSVEGVASEANQVQHISEYVPHNLKASATHTANEAFSRSGTGLLIQRKEPTTEQSVANLEKHQQARDMHQKATDLDLLWQAKFAKQLSSYQETIVRISGGLQAAIKGFQGAQAKQAETDAMVWAVIGAMVTIAGGFEWAFASGLGKLGNMEEKVADRIVSVAHAGADVAVDAAKEGSGKAETPELPSIPGAQTPAGAAGGDPLAFLTSNSAKIEHYRQNILDAFIKRSSVTRNYSDDDWLDNKKFNPNDQEQLYQQLFDNLQKVASDADKLKPDPEIALVLERHLWARWISDQADALLAEQAEEEARGDVIWSSGGAENYSIGSDVEVRLTEVGMADKAVVTLTGHWYSSNDPDNWRELLLKCARNYDGSIALGGKD